MGAVTVIGSIRASRQVNSVELLRANKEYNSVFRKIFLVGSWLEPTRSESQSLYVPSLSRLGLQIAPITVCTAVVTVPVANTRCFV